MVNPQQEFAKREVSKCLPALRSTGVQVPCVSPDDLCWRLPGPWPLSCSSMGRGQQREASQPLALFSSE